MSTEPYVHARIASGSDFRGKDTSRLCHASFTRGGAVNVVTEARIAAQV